jgi:hypothetical protein
MKRHIAAVSFAVLAIPAFAAGLPYEQNQVDRALPNVPAKAVRAEAPRFAAAAGTTRSDAEISTDARAKRDAGAKSVWATDHNFIAPAQ